MRSSILDNFEEPQATKYINKSLRFLLFGIATYILLIIINVQFRWYAHNVEVFAAIGVALGLTAFTFTLLGFINAIRSIRKKERAPFKKFLGLTANFLLVLIMILIIYANSIRLASM